MDEIINRRNYLWVRDYLKYLTSSRRLSEKSVSRYKAYLRHLLLWAVEIPLNNANKVSMAFPSYVADIKYTKGHKTNLPLAVQTQKKIIITCRMFFNWAKTYHEKEFSRLPSYWINDLTPPKVTTGNHPHHFVTFIEILKIANLSIPWENLALIRDRAAACFLFLSGIRAGAFTSLPLESVNLRDREIYQWPQEYQVKTKNNRSETTILLDAPELLQVVTEWDHYLRTHIPKELFRTYFWYPPIKSDWGEMRLSFEPPGKNRTQALNKRLRLLFKFADIDFKSAHKFRHGHAVFGIQHCKNMSEYQALSRNLMHKNIAITDEIYAGINFEERKKLLSGLFLDPKFDSTRRSALLLKDLDKNELLKIISAAVQKLSNDHAL